ncbi:hypothetical protein RIF29_39332 [Crotalaria pallida]|uniref:Uncharacterized protein n=1 Tax=Crotalaria pallida TaxID=3830 RepID=A0AAN9E1I5_CROPI
MEIHTVAHVNLTITHPAHVSASKCFPTPPASTILFLSPLSPKPYPTHHSLLFFCFSFSQHFLGFAFFSSFS